MRWRATGAPLLAEHVPAKPGEMPRVIVDPVPCPLARVGPQVDLAENSPGLGLVAPRERGVTDRGNDARGCGGRRAVMTSVAGRPARSASVPFVRSAAPPPVGGPVGESIDDAATREFLAQLGGRRLHELAVVIAAYDEEGGIAGVVRDVPRTVRGLGVDVIVVVDGARDRTAEQARSVPDVLVADVPVNRGQGAALRLGYRLAREGGAGYIATLDGDGQYDPAELEQVLEPILAGRADFVSGSRRLGAAHTSDRVRGAGVVVFGAVLSVLARCRITDPANGLRAMRAEVTALVPLHQPQYQASELLLGAALRGFRLAEVPTTMRVRSAGGAQKATCFRCAVRPGHRRDLVAAVGGRKVVGNAVPAGGLTPRPTGPRRPRPRSRGISPGTARRRCRRRPPSRWPSASPSCRSSTGQRNSPHPLLPRRRRS